MTGDVQIPIIELWGHLIVPLQGDLNDTSADRLEIDLLARVKETAPPAVIIDLSGVWMVDSHLCAVLARIAAAAAHMGSRTVISGLSPEIVFTLQTMGIDLEDVKTAPTLEQAFEVLGVRVDTGARRRRTMPGMAPRRPDGRRLHGKR